jgi:hypothetical protein
VAGAETEVEAEVGPDGKIICKLYIVFNINILIKAHNKNLQEQG